MRKRWRGPVPGCFLLIEQSAGSWRSRFLLGSGDHHLILEASLPALRGPGVACPAVNRVSVSVKWSANCMHVSVRACPLCCSDAAHGCGAGWPGGELCGCAPR